MIFLSELLGLQTGINWNDLIKLICRFALNLATASIVIKIVYSKLYQKRDYIFTYYMFNIVTFSLCILLRKVPAELGFALAIFAVFGVLRYRTEQISISNLTYLFIVIGIGIINAVANRKISLFELLFVNLAISGSTVFLELIPAPKRTHTVPMLYDRMELLNPNKKAELLEDVILKTGLNIVNIEIIKIDALRDSAEILIHYLNDEN